MSTPALLISAQQKLDDAERLASSWGIISLLTGTPKLMRASELARDSGNSFRAAQDFIRAGLALRASAGFLARKAEGDRTPSKVEKVRIANDFRDAADAFATHLRRAPDGNDGELALAYQHASECFQNAIVWYDRAGTSDRTCQLEMRAGELHRDLGHYEEAVEAFARAGERFRDQHQSAHAEKAYMDAAYQSVLNRAWPRAADMYREALALRSDRQRVGLDQLGVCLWAAHLAAGSGEASSLSEDTTKLGMRGQRIATQVMRAQADKDLGLIRKLFAQLLKLYGKAEVRDCLTRVMRAVAPDPDDSDASPPDQAGPPEKSSEDAGVVEAATGTSDLLD